VICAGIDAGSRATKVVLLESPAGRVVASGLVDQGLNPDAVAAALLRRVLAESELTRHAIRRIIATGYARSAVSSAHTTVTEITCQARAVCSLVPEARTVIDIGGQDSKVLHLDEAGEVRDFAMNDRCAAGSGRFLEVLAARFQVGLEALGELAARSHTPAPINSTCVVFAETEIIGLLAAGAEPSDIAAGVAASIATRIAALAAGRATPPVILTGGVALVPNMAAALSATLRQPIRVAPTPQFTGALGAALIAADQSR